MGSFVVTYYGPMSHAGQAPERHERPDEPEKPENGERPDRHGRFLLARMLPRDPAEPARAASTLELFFDLVFVIAVSQTSSQLHDGLTEGHLGHAIPGYLLVFFSIWWAWMNFTWFSTSFDTDDWLYRVLTIVQMSGVLVLAAGVEPVFVDDDFRLMIAGYVVMRLAMVAQWVRASRAPGMRTACLSYAAGIALAQVLWVAWPFLPEGTVRTAAVPFLVLAELAVPVVAERRGVRAGGSMTPWHPHHITERYGCFTLILLGESLLASSSGIIEAREEAENLVPLVELAVLAFVITAALWWSYFWAPHHRQIGSSGSSLRYGYGHYVLFAAAGALSAGIEVELDALTGASGLFDTAAAYAFAVPVAIFLLTVWIVAMRGAADRVVDIVMPLAAVAVLCDPLIPAPVALTTFVLVVVVVVLIVRAPIADTSRLNHA